jgi:hypothetical protein
VAAVAPGLRRALALGAAVLLLVEVRALAQAPPPGEHQVKAAFLYHFARYVEWPPEAFPGQGEAFVITVLGADPFGAALDGVVRGKSVRERRLLVRRVARPEDVGDSQILFIGEMEEEELARVLRRLEATPVLTVGDVDRFAERGGIINFRRERDRVGFDINLTSAERAGLKISSQLLKLARIVSAGGRG